MVPSYSGFFSFAFVLGLVHSFSPVASPTKLATVLGASFENKRTTMSPWVVWKVAYSSFPCSASFMNLPSPELFEFALGEANAAAPTHRTTTLSLRIMYPFLIAMAKGPEGLDCVGNSSRRLLAVPGGFSVFSRDRPASPTLPGPQLVPLLSCCAPLRAHRGRRRSRPRPRRFSHVAAHFRKPPDTWA